MSERIILGSGKLYVAVWDGSTIPADATIEVESNLLGLIQGGASLSYTPSFYEAKDDLGLVSKSFITDEIAILKSGIMTFNAATLNKLISTGTLTETTSLRTLKIGGASNFVDKKYVCQFVHTDAVDGDVRVTIVGSNNTGLELAFAKDKETVINCEFKAVPHDSTGTLIIYKEEIPAA
jgi:hypothetical protein